MGLVDGVVCTFIFVSNPTIVLRLCWCCVVVGVVIINLFTLLNYLSCWPFRKNFQKGQSRKYLSKTQRFLNHMGGHPASITNLVA